MGESLMERRRVRDEGLRVVNRFCCRGTPTLIEQRALRNRDETLCSISVGVTVDDE